MAVGQVNHTLPPGYTIAESLAVMPPMYELHASLRQGFAVKIMACSFLLA